MNAIVEAGHWAQDEKKLTLLKNTLCQGMQTEELSLFVEVAKSTGLNPFQNQICAIKRQVSVLENGEWIKKDKFTIQTQIDGYRLIAARTGLHAGTSDAVFGPESAEGYPAFATVTVNKLLPNGCIAPFSATARWKEYAAYFKDSKTKVEKLGTMWQKMPYGQLAKCAEALALRKAFPNDLSGIYTQEEMEQANIKDITPEHEKLANPIKYDKEQLLTAAQAIAPYGVNALKDFWQGLNLEQQKLLAPHKLELKKQAANADESKAADYFQENMLD